MGGRMPGKHYGYFHPAFQAKVRARLDGKQAPNVMEFPVAAPGIVPAGPRAPALQADKGYDHRRCRRECRARNITPRIARRGIESSEHLGRHRWIVERTLAWLARFRRLTIRYERRVDLHLAFTTLACVPICGAQLSRFCPCL
jgi:IS5 family transposase